VRIELTIEVLQTSALPLGYRAASLAKATHSTGRLKRKALAGAGLQELERETGFEPATSTLARSHSTTELLPLVASFYSTCIFADNSHWP
jgi:hypothetical protein